jgi:integrase
MILLLRFYGLRISDVATLAKDRLRGDEIFLHTLKNQAAVWLPLYPEVKQALDCLPLPQGADPDFPYFFWTGKGDADGHVKTVDRTLQAVFAKSGVPHAHAHRFRHTLATEIPISGGTIEDAANILEDTPEVIRKHYAKWSREYQERTVRIMDRVHGRSTRRGHGRRK